jgi:hypothetical protein
LVGFKFLDLEKERNYTLGSFAVIREDTRRVGRKSELSASVSWNFSFGNMDLPSSLFVDSFYIIEMYSKTKFIPWRSSVGMIFALKVI